MWDVLVLGAGAAGMMAASVAGQKGRRVALIDQNAEVGKKILISGGGRCNFTHLEAQPSRYFSQNPHFCRSALARYRSEDFLKLVQSYHIAWHEKDKGQLFCDYSAKDIVNLLVNECKKGGVSFFLSHHIRHLSHHGDYFELETSGGILKARSIILATGGLAIPKLGATDLSLRIARQFGAEIIAPQPALVPLIMEKPLSEFAGLSLMVKTALETPKIIKNKKKISFTDGMVFTHRGVSGPAILQISSYRDKEHLQLNFMPGQDILKVLIEQREKRPKAHAPILLESLPSRFARYLTQNFDDRALAAQPLHLIKELANKLENYPLKIAGTEGYAKAEVMRGGIDTNTLSSKTMEFKEVPGLFAVGEAVDVTGWLGGYNFQWAWSSGFIAGEASAERHFI